MFVFVLIAGTILTGAAQPATPRTVVRQALRAVEGDSAARVALRWNAALAGDSSDPLPALGLATLARFSYDYPTADRAYMALIAAHPKRGVGKNASISYELVREYAELGLASSFDARGLARRADSAFSHVRRVAGIRGDRIVAADALIGLSVNRGSQLGVRVGIALLDTAQRLLAGGVPDLQADIAVRRALFATVLSRPTAGRDALAAAAIAERAGEPRLEARALRALALGLELSDHMDSAGVVLSRVEQIERAVHDRGTLAETLMRHGDIYHNRGDIGVFKGYALAAQAEALASQNLFALASSSVGLGAVALMIDDFPTADAYLHQAAVQYDSMADRSGVALVQTYQADLAADLGRWSVARDLAEAVRAFDHTIGDPAEFEEWRDLVAIAIHAGNLTDAEHALAAAEAMANARHQTSWNASLDLNRGQLALAEGRPVAAARVLTRYLQGLDAGEHVVRYTARALLAQAEAREGSLSRAELELTAAADELDAWRSSLTDRELRPYVFQANGMELNDRDASVAVVLAAMAAGRRAPAAFALAERRRSRDVADRLVELAAMGDQGLSTNGRRGSGRPPGSLTAEGDVAIRATAERGAADSTAAALPDTNTALLEYVTGGRGAPTTLFVVARSPGVRLAGRPTAAMRGFVLASADSLAPEIARFVAAIESGANVQKLGRQLATATVDSALAVLGSGINHLIIVPDGPLHRLPFDALRLPDGSPLVSQYAISVAPSAAAIRAIWRRPRPAAGDRRPMRLLALADPAFARTTSESRGVENYREFLDSGGALPRLVESGREARLVARYAPYSEVRLGADASAAYLLHAPVDQFRVIHIATHALVDERSLARTALALAPGGGESGFVTPAQLASLRLRADMIVLSACRTAGGVIIDGDGVQGLTGPLLAAGARSVVATQWRIGDRSVVPLVTAFYGALARGLNVDDALRAAKMDAIARGAPAAEWAAFTVVGDPFVRLALRFPPSPVREALMVVTVLLAIGAALLFGMRHLRERPDI